MKTHNIKTEENRMSCIEGIMVTAEKPGMK
jgi:hypothetical protein